MAYASAAQVAAFVKKYAGSAFSTSTHPTAVQVGVWLDNVSAILDALLAEQGFDTPITQATAVLALDLFVAQEVAALCEAANSSGRFFSEEARGAGMFGTIMKDVEDFITVHSEGLEQLGATRDRRLSVGLDYWSESDAGEAMEPVFELQGWMRQTMIDWDTD